MMLEATDTKHAPWYILRSDDKKRARLNCIAHLLSSIPYKKVPREKVKLPKRSMKGAYDDQASLEGPEVRARAVLSPRPRAWTLEREAAQCTLRLWREPSGRPSINWLLALIPVTLALGHRGDLRPAFPIPETLRRRLTGERE